jgi:hypothetical protein
MLYLCTCTLQAGLAKQHGEAAEEASQQLRSLRAAHDGTCSELQRKVLLLTAISRMASKAGCSRSSTAGQLQEVWTGGRALQRPGKQRRTRQPSLSIS